MTKSEFLKYLQCPEYFWMSKYQPDVLNESTIDPFAQQIIDQGIEVEEWARKLFPSGVMISSWKEAAISDTLAAIDTGDKVLFQPAFSADGLTARVDILEKTDKGWNIYEVKGSTSKDKKKIDHYWDAGFQREVMTRSGYIIDRVFLIELDKTFVKCGDINPHDLLKETDITEVLDGMQEEINLMISGAKAKLAERQQPARCNCHLKPRKHQCPAFLHFNPDFPEYAVHDISRISFKKLIQFDEIGVVAVDDIPHDFELSEIQSNQVNTYLNDEPIIKHEEIAKQLDLLEYPLYFLDYETFPAAVPQYDGCYPFQQVPFQYSLHVVETPFGEYKHSEYLHLDGTSPTRAIAEALCSDIGEKGSVIVWNKKFERKCNEDLADMYPDLAPRFHDINDRIFDLMEVFSKQNYIHKDFRGKASIKKVLPVICPELTYEGLNIAEGGAACSSWKSMVFSDIAVEQKKMIKQDLLAYCKLDTWAMVRIWEEMKSLTI